MTLVQFNIRLPKDLAAAVKAEARRREESIENVAAALMRAALHSGKAEAGIARELQLSSLNRIIQRVEQIRDIANKPL